MESLRKLGLTEYECMLYHALLKQGALTADKLAQHSKVPITAVYPNMRALIEKELVQKISGKTAIFSPLPPALALEKLANRKKKELEEYEKEALQALQSIEKEEQGEKNKGVLLITEGRDISVKIYTEAAAHARKSYYIMGWRFEKVGDKYSMLHEFKRLIKKSVDVRIILTESQNKQWELIKDYQKEGIKMRSLPLENFSIFVVDGKECKITLKDRSLPNRFNISILDSSFAKAMESYFLECWKKAKEIY